MDGVPEDTINVLDTEHIQQIVRLAGINAPERMQPFSEVAHQHLAALVCSATDTSGTAIDRLVGVVSVDDADAGLDQVRAGMALPCLCARAVA